MLQDHLDAQILKITGVAGVDTNDGVTSQEDANPRLMVPTRGRPIWSETDANRSAHVEFRSVGPFDWVSHHLRQLSPASTLYVRLCPHSAHS